MPDVERHFWCGYEGHTCTFITEVFKSFMNRRNQDYSQAHNNVHSQLDGVITLSLVQKIVAQEKLL